MLSVSALRGTAGTGILWAVRRDTNGVGTLDAYDATNVAMRLYSSNTNSARDSLGTGSRLGHFTVADGKVFVPTFSRQVVAYGLLSTPALTSVAVTPANPTGQAGATQQFTATGTYSDNTTKDITSQVTWSSSNTAVASINAAGLQLAPPARSQYPLCRVESRVLPL